jgi:hypothetical protein
VLPGAAQLELYGQFLDKYGKLIGSPFAIVSTTDGRDRFAPAAVYDSDNDRFFVVYEVDYYGDPSNHDIRGSFIDWDGPNLSYAEVLIGVDLRSERYPRVAISPKSNAFLVVWQGEDPDGVHRIDGAVVGSASMQFIMDLDIAGGGTEPRKWPDVAWNVVRDEFLVVYDDGEDVYARVVGFSPMSVGVERSIAGWPDSENQAAVATCGEDHFLVGWRSWRAVTQYDAIARFVTAEGTTEAGEHSAPFALSEGLLEESDVEISCADRNQEYLAIWQISNVSLGAGTNGRRVTVDRSIRPQFGVAPISSLYNTQSFVAGGRSGWFVAWAKRPEDFVWDIHGRAVYALFADGFEDSLDTWSSSVP